MSWWERLRPIRAQFFFTQSLSDAVTADVQSSTLRRNKLEARRPLLQWMKLKLNSGEWMKLEEKNLNIPVQFYRLGKQKRNIKNLMFHKHDNQLLFFTSRRNELVGLIRQNDKTLSSWFIFFFCSFGATRNWLLVWQLSRSETLMMKAAKTLNVNQDEVLHIAFCTKKWQ